MTSGNFYYTGNTNIKKRRRGEQLFQKKKNNQ